MGQESSKQDRSKGVADNDKGWLKEAVDSLTKDDKSRAEEEIGRSYGPDRGSCKLSERGPGQGSLKHPKQW